MRPIYAPAIALTAAIVLCGAAVQRLQAQTTPPAYTIVEIDVIDPEAHKRFVERNSAGIAAAGGRFLARRGKIVTSEGVPPKAVSVIAWGSLDEAVAYFNSPTFQELIPLRNAAANVRSFHVEGLME